MQGYLYLMRQGLDTDAARACRDPEYNRLVHNVWNAPYRNRL